jgi:hypothetical protein
MHHRMPPSKTGWPSLNVVIFPPVMRLILDDINSFKVNDSKVGELDVVETGEEDKDTDYLT